MTAQKKKTILVWIQRLLLVAGFSALGYCAFVSIKARHYQKQAQEQMLNEEKPLEATDSGSEATPVKQSHDAEKEGAPLGRIEIPSVHISAMVAKGTSSQVLQVAVGHVPGTALPGEPGNVALAAHRDTFFRGLGEIKTGDLIRFTTPEKQYVYRVSSTDVVSPSDTWVLNPGSHQELTLITCYPFHFIGPAPKRFIVRASRLEND